MSILEPLPEYAYMFIIITVCSKAHFQQKQA